MLYPLYLELFRHIKLNLNGPLPGFPRTYEYAERFRLLAGEELLKDSSTKLHLS
jgi:hypothetical protein